MKFMPLCAAAVALLLGGCTKPLGIEPTAISEQTIANVRSLNDAAAIALRASLCQMSVGAKNRNFSDDEKGSIEALCGGKSNAVTVGDVQRLQELMAARVAP